MRNFPFKESEYDFDDVLIERGFTLKQDREEYLIYSKPINVVNTNLIEHKDKTDFILKNNKNRLDKTNPFELEVSHPKVLNSVAKYYLYGPYEITATYFINPNYALRQMMWKMFPGNKKEFLEETIDIAEQEAKMMYSICVNSDLKLYDIKELKKRLNKIGRWDIEEN